MGKSINPMGTSKIRGEAVCNSAPSLIALKHDSFAAIVLMSLQPAIPWRVALLHCPPPLHRLDYMFHPPAGTVNHHFVRAGEFSAGVDTLQDPRRGTPITASPLLRLTACSTY